MDQYKTKQLNEIFKGVEIYNDILQFASDDRDRKMHVCFIDDETTRHCENFKTFKAFKKYIKENYIKAIYEKFKKPLICEYDNDEKRFECGFSFSDWDWTRDKGVFYNSSRLFKFYLYIEFEK